MLKFNLEKSLTIAKFNHSWVYNGIQLGSSISLLGGCLDLVDRLGLGGCSGVDVTAVRPAGVGCLVE